MTNVLEFPTKDDNEAGYLIDDRKVEGVYVNNIAAMIDNGNVYLGTKGDGGIDDAMLTSKEDLNEFCLMWLLMFDPDVIKDD